MACLIKCFVLKALFSLLTYFMLMMFSFLERLLQRIFLCFLTFFRNMANFQVKMWIGTSLTFILVGLSQSLKEIIGVNSGSIPFNYLGVPLFYGAPRRKWLQPIADRIISKFANWKGSSLSMAGRLMLINSVILSSFLHSFSVYKWAKSLLVRMKKCIRNFLWTSSVNVRKLVVVP